MNKKYPRPFILIPFIVAAITALLYFLPFFRIWEEGLYNVYCRIRPQTPVDSRILLLDVDDTAIQNVGTWPWPRGYMADGLLILKEFNAGSAVFDIEYVTKSPPALDAQYLQNGLERDFSRSFSDIAANTSDLILAFGSGQIPLRYAPDYAQELNGLIQGEHDSLLKNTKNLARDNDAYLGKAMALYGKVSTTVNIFNTQNPTPSDAKKAAFEKFSYRNVVENTKFARENNDFTATIEPVTEGSRTAGFTNVTVDTDGTRRRVKIAQKVNEEWFLQLVAAPLFYEYGNPRLTINDRSIGVEGKDPQNGTPIEFSIPLDKDGNMFIDWPRGSYNSTFRHLSFNSLLYYTNLEAYIGQLLFILGNSPAWLLPDTKGQLVTLYGAVQEINADYAEMEKYRAMAVENGGKPEGDLFFSDYLEVKQSIFRRVGDILESLPQVLDNTTLLLTNASHKKSAETAKTTLLQLQDALTQRERVSNLLSENLADAFCIIGWTATGTTDIGVNPFDSEYVNVGTHAAVVNTISNRSFITYADTFVSFLLTFIFPQLLMFIFYRFGKMSYRGIGVMFVLLLLIGGSLALFSFYNIYTGILGVSIATILAVICAEISAFISTARDKTFLQKAFGTYLSPVVIEQIISNPDLLKLGGTKRYMSAIFTDIKGFSSISEQMDPEALVSLLNRYLSTLSNEALAEQGTIDKYEGDAIIAFFGAPVEVPDHASRALRTAVAMKKAEARLNEELLQKGLTPSPLLTRIGVNTGEMVVGNMGTERKMDYTIMGNAVNLAARLEGVNKQYGSWILTSDSTLSKTGEEFLYRRFNKVRVVGIQEPVQLYEILDIKMQASDEQKRLVESFHAAMDIFEKRNWTQALSAFKSLLAEFPEDLPTKSYIERCQRFAASPPPANWDGVFTLTEK